jgi:hypothetical protein
VEGEYLEEDERISDVSCMSKEKYDEVNARMSALLGARAFGRRENEGVGRVQGRGVKGLVFRAEPPDAIQFEVDEGAGVVTMRVKQVESSAGDVEDVAVSASSFTRPFTMTGAIVESTARISVFPGIVNNVVPKIGANSLVALPRPTLTVTGASGIVYMIATVDVSGTITDLVIENTASAVPPDTETLKHRIIGTWLSSGGVFTDVSSLLNANQTLFLCNGTAIWEP